MHVGKSVAHGTIQDYLKLQIPTLELEKKIGKRRADAAWEDQKIVFELQLSSISEEEVVTRGRDYASYGYQVVWLLHDGEFNTRQVSPAERLMRASFPTYFTNGHSFYDQMEVIEGGSRRYQGSPLPVDLSCLSKTFLKLPDRAWPLHSKGDLHTWCETFGVKQLHRLLRSHRFPQGIRWWLHFIGFRLMELTCIPK